MFQTLTTLVYLAVICAVLYGVWKALAGLWGLVTGQSHSTATQPDRAHPGQRKNCPACGWSLPRGVRTCEACGLRLDSDAGRELRELEITARHVQQLLDDTTANLVLARIQERRQYLLHPGAPAVAPAPRPRERSLLE